MESEIHSVTNLYEDLQKESLIKLINDLKAVNINKEGFILNITHDLRGHLNVIISAIQYMVHNNNLNNEDIKYINIIKRNSYKMLKLINNLIDTDRLENNYYKLSKENVNIISMVEGTVECIAKYASEKNISLIFDTNEEECVMAIDPQAIDRIIMNILSNAIKFSDSNTNIYIFLQVNKDEIKISIKDQGVGISEEEQVKIFDRFFQSSIRNDKDNIGSGIGLDLSNYLVKSHGGHINLNSKLGEGAEFIITLPIYINNELPISEDKYSNKIQMLEIEFSDIYLS